MMVQVRCENAYSQLRTYRFDDARDTFENVLLEDPENIAALWGVLLARFGVVFIKGFYKNVVEPIYCFQNYDRMRNRYVQSEREFIKLMQLLENDNELRFDYEHKAKKIDDAIDDFKKYKEETERDVFICVKISAATSANPELKGTTEDYELAMKLYEDLEARGVNTFFSYVTLKNDVDSDEKIWRNLVKSKKMLLVASKEEYLESPWVKSEWKRWLFLKREKELYIYILNKPDESPYDILPNEFANNQIYTHESYKKLLKDICDGLDISSAAALRKKREADERKRRESEERKKREEDERKKREEDERKKREAEERKKQELIEKSNSAQASENKDGKKNGGKKAGVVVGAIACGVACAAIGFIAVNNAPRANTTVSQQSTPAVSIPSNTTSSTGTTANTIAAPGELNSQQSTPAVSSPTNTTSSTSNTTSSTGTTTNTTTNTTASSNVSSSDPEDLMNEANIAADKQAVNQMNKVLATAQATESLIVEGNDSQTSIKIYNALIANGYSYEFDAYYEKYSFGYVVENGNAVIVLVEDSKVAFPENYAGKTDYKQFFTAVENADELVSAFNTGYVLLKTDAVFENPIEISNDLTIVGNNKILDEGHLNYDSGANSAVSIKNAANDITVSMNGIGIENKKDTYARGLNLGNNTGKITLILDNVSIESYYYALNLTSSNTVGVEIIVRNSTITGWAAVNVWSKVDATFENCTIVGNSVTTNVNDTFAAIVINGTSELGTSYAEGSNLTFKNCTIETNTNAATNNMYHVSVGVNSSVTFEGCTFMVNGEEVSELTSSAVDGANVTINGTTDLMNEANRAADTALAKELNTAIAMSETDVDTFDQAVAALREGGFILANFNAKADGCYFVWDDVNNQILYVDAKDGFKVLYSNGQASEMSKDNWILTVSNKAKADEIVAMNAGITVKVALANVKDLSAALAAGGEIYIDESVVLDSENKLTIDSADADVTLKFAGSKVTTGSTIQGIPVEVKHGKLRVYDAVIGGAGEFTNEYGTFSTAVGFDGTTELYLNNCTIAGIGNAVAGSNNDDGEAYVEINNCTLSSNNVGFQLSTWGTGVLNNTTINCPNPIFASYGANITINGGDYTSTSDCMIEIYDNTANAPEGKTTTVTIKKGNFTFETFAKFNGSSKIVIEGGTFNGVNYLEYFKSADAASAITGGATININGTTVTISKR
ncbi:MAG: TIR domain-containing protein [Clostridia bacterium]|nr:TIR domain-containing protein [Clostridia bacterium]